MNVFRILGGLALISGLAGAALFFAHSFAYVAVLVVAAVFAMGALAAKVVSRPSAVR